VNRPVGRAMAERDCQGSSVRPHLLREVRGAELTCR
jgi:hypothetical protein